MPNPMMRLGTPNQSKQAPDRPEPIAPIPEAYEGANHPYRGIEDHGVPDTAKPEDFAGYDGTRDAYYELVEPPKDVVPVRIVPDTDGGRTRRIMRTHVMQLTVGDPPRVLLGQNDQRTKANIKCFSSNATDFLWLGGSAEQANSLQGYPVPIGQAFGTHETLSQANVYGSVAGGSANGTVINVWVSEELTVDI
jgi:hypothetical protein